MKMIACLALGCLLVADCATFSELISNEEMKAAKLNERHWMTVTFERNNKERTKVTYDLVRYKVSGLGLTRPASLGEIFAAARARGLGICPEETGIAARLEYPDQPEGETLFLAMEPVSEGFKGTCIYAIKMVAGKRIMDPYYLKDGISFAATDEFIFASPR